MCICTHTCTHTHFGQLHFLQFNNKWLQKLMLFLPSLFFFMNLEILINFTGYFIPKNI